MLSIHYLITLITIKGERYIQNLLQLYIVGLQNHSPICSEKVTVDIRDGVKMLISCNSQCSIGRGKDF